MTLAIQEGPSKLGEAELMLLVEVQGIAQTMNFMHYMRTATAASKLTLISCVWVQHQEGWNKPTLVDAEKSTPH
eukprot:944744-Ditylum_brightwellii.AAC.1